MMQNADSAVPLCEGRAGHHKASIALAPAGNAVGKDHSAMIGLMAGAGSHGLSDACAGIHSGAPVRPLSRLAEYPPARRPHRHLRA